MNTHLVQYHTESPDFRSHALFTDAPPEVLEQQLQTFLQSLNITHSTSTADDPKYYEFLTGEPNQAVSDTDWASEYQQQAGARPGQDRQRPHQSLSDQQAHEEAWGAARQASGLDTQPRRLHPSAALGSEWANAFQQSQNPAPQSWAEDFSRLQLDTPAQQPAPAHPSDSWVSDFQSRQPQPIDQAWAQQFLAGNDQQWAEQFASDQEQAEQRQLSPEEQKALRGPHPDDPLDDKAALSWVRQFNEVAAEPSVNFGMLVTPQNSSQKTHQRSLLLVLYCLLMLIRLACDVMTIQDSAHITDVCHDPDSAVLLQHSMNKSSVYYGCVSQSAHALMAYLLQ